MQGNEEKSHRRKKSNREGKAENRLRRVLKHSHSATGPRKGKKHFSEHWGGRGPRKTVRRYDGLKARARVPMLSTFTGDPNLPRRKEGGYREYPQKCIDRGKDGKLKLNPIKKGEISAPKGEGADFRRRTPQCTNGWRTRRRDRKFESSKGGRETYPRGKGARGSREKPVAPLTGTHAGRSLVRLQTKNHWGGTGRSSVGSMGVEGLQDGKQINITISKPHGKNHNPH